jgi:hypothetical protein
MKKAPFLCGCAVLLSLCILAGCSGESGGTPTKSGKLAPNASPQQRAEYEAAQKMSEADRADALGTK